MLRMRNTKTQTEGALIWLAGSWHLYYSEGGSVNAFVVELDLTDWKAAADDLIYLLDYLAIAGWEVIG